MFSHFSLMNTLAANFIAWGWPGHGELSQRPVYTIKMKDHISFGDSYSAERFDNDPETPSGGHVWSRFAADYTGSNLHSFAVSGAVFRPFQVPI